MILRVKTFYILYFSLFFKNKNSIPSKRGKREETCAWHEEHRKSENKEADHSAKDEAEAKVWIKIKLKKK